MHDRDPAHWLWRLSDRDWLDAAERELELGREHLGSRRTAITHARRAAGMALNGVLVARAPRGWSRGRCETVWGRSYLDHLRSLADPERASHGPLGPEQSEVCRTLLDIPVMPHTGLVRLAARKDEASSWAIAVATEIVRACAAVLGDPTNSN